MRVIEKYVISTSPEVGKKYELTIDLVGQSMTYKDGFASEEMFSKISDAQKQVAQEVLSTIQQLDPKKYQGKILTHGFYWEFDLISDRHKMIEIEGINAIDQQVLDCLKNIEQAFNKPLGVSILSDFIR